MTTTPPLYPIITSGIEYKLIPVLVLEEDDTFPFQGSEDNDKGWESVTFDDIPEAIELNGFRITTRHYTETCDEDINGNLVCDRVYNPFEIVSQKISVSSPGSQVFLTPNDKNLFGATPKAYSNVAPDIPTGGIIDGSKYGYVNIFDQADISYIPRASTPDQEVIRNPTNLPSFSQEYAIDALTGFAPDPRESVTLQYSMTTEYRIGGGATITDTFTWIQIVFQEVGDVADKLKAFMEKSFFYDGKYHIQLYPTGYPLVYDDNGNPNEGLTEPEYDGLNLVNSVVPIGFNNMTGNKPQDYLNTLNMGMEYEYPDGTSSD